MTLTSGKFATLRHRPHDWTVDSVPARTGLVYTVGMREELRVGDFFGGRWALLQSVSNNAFYNQMPSFRVETMGEASIRCAGLPDLRARCARRRAAVTVSPSCLFAATHVCASSIADTPGEQSRTRFGQRRRRCRRGVSLAAQASG